MNVKEREELLIQMESFRKKLYSKQELLPEMLKLQDDIVRIVFNKEYGPLGEKRIDDAIKELKKINNSRGGIANEQISLFEKESTDLSNRIKAEISGKKGEERAFRKIDTISSYKRVLKNIELENEKQKTELDAIVVMKNGLTIVEVKNNAKDIFIDEDGNYFINGNYQRWDCNIEKAMLLKESLLRKELERHGIYGLAIHSIVVFTNNIEIHNIDRKVHTCFLGQLPFYIINGSSSKILSREKIDSVARVIGQLSHVSEYPFDFNVSKYKEDFADLMVALNQEKNSEKLYETDKTMEAKTMRLDTQSTQYFERKQSMPPRFTYVEDQTPKRDEEMWSQRTSSEHFNRRQSTIWEKVVDECSDFIIFGGGATLCKVAGGVALIAAGLCRPRIASLLLRRKMIL